MHNHRGGGQTMENNRISVQTARKLANEGKIEGIDVGGSAEDELHITHTTASGERRTERVETKHTEQATEEGMRLRETCKIAGNIVGIDYKTTPQICSTATWEDITGAVDPKEVAAIELRRSDRGESETKAKTGGTYRVETHMLDAQGQSIGQLPSPQVRGLASGSMYVGGREIPFAKHESILDFGNEEFMTALVGRGGQSSADHIDIASNKNGTFTPQITHGVDDHPSGKHTRPLLRDPETKAPIEFGTQREAHEAAWQFTMADRKRTTPALELRETGKEIQMKEDRRDEDRAQPQPHNLFTARLQPTTDVLKQMNIAKQRSERTATERGEVTPTPLSKANPEAKIDKEKSTIRKMTMLVIAGTGIAIAGAMTGGIGWAVAAAGGLMAIHGARKVSENAQEIHAIQNAHAEQTETSREDKGTGKNRNTPEAMFDPKHAPKISVSSGRTRTQDTTAPATTHSGGHER